MKDHIEFKVMQVTDRGLVKVGHAYVDATRLWPPSEGMPPVEIFLTDDLQIPKVPKGNEADQIVLQLTWPLKGEHADGT